MVGMLGKKSDGDMVAFLGTGTEFTGKLILKGSIRIEGVFNGEILGEGTLMIGEGARIEGDIAVDRMVIHGEVRGTLNAKERLEICTSGHVRGNITTPVLVIQEGAFFLGECHMAVTGSDRTEREEE